MSLFSLNQMEENCLKCGLYKNCKSSKMNPFGLGKTKTLLLGEAPGKTEDEQGRQFVGKSGQVLQEQIAANKLDFNSDFWRFNAVNCWPNVSQKRSRTPTAKEVKFCHPLVEETIQKLSPKFIIPIGSTALDTLFFTDFEKIAISIVHGKIIPDQKYNCWIMPVFHPSYVMCDEFNYNLKSVYSRDMQRACSWIKKKKEVPRYDLKFDLITDFPSIIQLLKQIAREKQTVYFDYETTGLKPFRPGHKIVCVSMSVNGKTFAFPFQYQSVFSFEEQEQIRKLLARIFTVCPLEAHNIQFEDSWTKHIIGVEPKRWRFDTMIAAHILDNRSGVAGLKMQIYLNFGIRPYDRNVNSFLQSNDPSGFNSVEKFPLMELLEYCAKDSGYGSIISSIQKKELKENDLVFPYKLFHDGTLVLSEMYENGICIDEKHFDEQDKMISEQILQIEKELLLSKENMKYKKLFGKDINLDSGKEIGELLFKVLKLKPTYTNKGNLSVDKNTLSDINIPFVTKLLERRKLEKVRGTYLAQFKREIYNNSVHPIFSIGSVSTYRSSSSNPNLQNIPVRDDLIKPIIRKGIKPSPGNVLFLFDFSGAEVRTSACYNQDAIMINYINDPTTDMHRDAASNIWALPKEEITKEIRFYAKNMWVFAQFYGSYWAACGENLWKTCIETLNLRTKSEIPLIEHLKTRNILSKNDFLEHCKLVEDKFWNEQFKGYSQWKKDINSEYQRNGFIRTFFGFKLQGYMDRKQVCNYPIQGHSFHILLWIAIQLSKFIKTNNLRAKMVLEIHDEIVFDIPEQEVKTIADEVNRLIHEELPKFEWALVPFEVEFSITPVNGSWHDKKDWKP